MNTKPLQDGAPKLTLITPSASPPISRSFFPQPYRIPDKASPTKRPRLPSAPRQFQPHASSSSSSPSIDQAIDFHQAREASTMRMFDIWSGLADRYSRPLDEDDIVDITTGEVVKDRGVIRGSQNWAVGCFADATVEDDDEEDEDEEDDDVDELDSFANTEVHGITLGVDGRKVPPVTQMDPADAHDLREFLEAERRRKEACGSEPEETESSVYESQNDEAEYSSRSSVPTNHRTASYPRRDATSQLDEDGSPVNDLEDDPTPLRRATSPHFVDSGSDDELDNWDIDEASIIHRLPKKKESNASESDDDEVEFVDSPMLFPASLVPLNSLFNSTTKSKTSPKSKPRPIQHQLHTPPRSQASSLIPSVAPFDDEFIELPPDSSSPPRTSSPISSSIYDSSPTKPPPLTRNTPKPRSENKRAPASLDDLINSSPPIPRLNLAKVYQKRLPKNKSNSRILDSPGPASGSKLMPPVEPKRQLTQLPLAPAPKPAKVVSTSKRPQVEVVIERRPPFKLPNNPASRQHETRYKAKGKEVPKVDQVLKRKSSATSIKAKGKEKYDPFDNWQDDTIDESNERVSLPPSPLRTSKKTTHAPRVQGPQPLPSSSRKESRKPVADPPLDSQELSTSKKSKYGQVVPETLSTATRKRKRIVSSPETDVQDSDHVRSMSVDRSTKNVGKVVSTAQKRLNETDSQPDFTTRENTVKQKPKRKSTPRHRSKYSGDDDSGSGNASQEEFDEPRHFSRAPSYFQPPTDYHFYPPSYPPHHRHHEQPPLYAPVPDPRAQFIISQAMHQLSALVGGPWPPAPQARSSTPYTTPRHQHYHDDGSSVLMTPTHHPHSYPYMYDPALSRGTLPPDSPQVLTSPVVGSGSRSVNTRRKSLVRRSQSRGRTVSFVIEEGAVDSVEMRSSQEGWRNKSKGRFREGAQDDLDQGANKITPSISHGEVKGKMLRKESDSEAAVEEPSRGRTFIRSQTPGPPPRMQSSNSRPDLHRDSSNRAKSRSGAGRAKTKS